MAWRAYLLRLCAGKPNALRWHPRAPAGFGLGLQERCRRAKESILPAGGVGESGALGTGSVLSGTPRSFLPRPTSLFHWIGADRSLAHGGTRHSDDPRVVEGCAWVTPVLHVWGNVSRVPGCAHR